MLPPCFPTSLVHRIVGYIARARGRSGTCRRAPLAGSPFAIEIRPETIPCPPHSPSSSFQDAKLLKRGHPNLAHYLARCADVLRGVYHSFSPVPWAR
jgi:hypothetical protein